MPSPVTSLGTLSGTSFPRSRRPPTVDVADCGLALAALRDSFPARRGSPGPGAGRFVDAAPRSSFPVKQRLVPASVRGYMKAADLDLALRFALFS